MEREKERNVFIGAKVLDESQVKLIVPTYDTIIEQINEMRTQAQSVRDQKVKAQYNNTIGLFGARGTGKSSTMMTIKKYLEKNNNNVILDTIEPDTFGENTRIMGAIIGLLKDAIDTIQNEIKRNEKDNIDDGRFFSGCRFIKNNILEQKYQEMLQAYCYTEDEYRKLLTSSFTDFETFKRKYSQVLKPDVELTKKITSFFDTLIEVKRKGTEEPMIFIFIDDVDLNTSKCKEIIDSIMKYTCHPNVICILSGDYEILNEAITMSLMENEDITRDYHYGTEKIFSGSRQFDGAFSIMDRKKYLTHEYLKKILPPAFRHNVVNWNLENIPLFSFGSRDDSEKGRGLLYEKLAEVFGEDSLFSKHSKLGLLKEPFNIFDKTPRGIVNVYYVLNKFHARKESNPEFDKFENIKLLIDTIINSSGTLVKYQSNIYNELIIWGADEGSTILKFDHMKELIEGHIDKKEKNESENMDASMPEDVLMNTFILAYMIKESLDDIKAEGYSGAKKAYVFLMYLKQLEKFNSKSNSTYKEYIAPDKVAAGNGYDKVYGNRGSVGREFTKYGQLKESISYFEILVNSRNMKDSINQSYNENIDIDKDIFNLIYDLSEVDKNIDKLKSWYERKQDEESFINTIRFLVNFSQRSDKSEIYGKVFSGFYGVAKKKFNKELTQNRVIRIYQYTEIVKNNFERIEDNSFFEENENVNYGLDTNQKMFKEKIEEYCNGKRFDGKMMDGYVRKNIKELITKFENQLSGEEINNRKAQTTEQKQKIKQFGESSKIGGINTKFKKTNGLVVNNLNKASDGSFQLDEIMKPLRNLANNNRVWYGQWEAQKLINELLKSTPIDIPFFSKENRELLLSYVDYMKKVDSSIKEDLELEERKRKMREALERVHNEVLSEKEIEAGKFKMDLSEFEPGEE